MKKVLMLTAVFVVLALWNVNTSHAAVEPARYVANLSQYQTNAPVATVLENSLGGTLVWTRVSAGIYRGTLVGAFPDASKIFWPNPLTLSDSGVIVGTVIIHWASEDSIEIHTYDSSGSDHADGILEYYQPYRLELRVYP